MDMKKLSLTFLLTGFAIFLVAQSPLEIRHNDLRAFLSPANGALAHPGNRPWMTLEREQQLVSLAYNAGFWFGGLDEAGELYVATAFYALPNPSSESDKVWYVTAGEVLSHIEDFEDNGVVDDPSPAVFSWPGKGNPFFSEYNDGIELAPDTFSPDFFDQNGDGIYNPAEGDYPAMSVRGCNNTYIPTQLGWSPIQQNRILQGDTVTALQGGLSLYTISCDGDHPLNDVVYARYKLENVSPSSYQDAYLGVVADPDIGCHENDYVGSFPDRLTAFAYDAPSAANLCPGNVPVFVDNPPFWGMDLYPGSLGAMLAADAEARIHYYHKSGNQGAGIEMFDPTSAMQFYNYLKGQWRDGSPLTVGGNGYGGEEATNFAFPGLPEQEGGWTEVEAENSPGDRRVLTSVGPFEFQPGEVHEFTLAFTYYESSGDLNSKAEGLRGQVDVLQGIYDDCMEIPSDCAQVINSAPAHSMPALDLAVYPNPAQDLLYIESTELPQKLVLIDQMGRPVLQAQQQMHLNVQGLPAGLYHLRLRFDGQWVSRKVVLQP